MYCHRSKRIDRHKATHSDVPGYLDSASLHPGYRVIRFKGRKVVDAPAGLASVSADGADGTNLLRAGAVARMERQRNPGSTWIDRYKAMHPAVPGNLDSASLHPGYAVIRATAAICGPAVTVLWWGTTTTTESPCAR
jgi:hypothetical protein